MLDNASLKLVGSPQNSNNSFLPMASMENTTDCDSSQANKFLLMMQNKSSNSIKHGGGVFMSGSPTHSKQKLGESSMQRTPTLINNVVMGDF